MQEILKNIDVDSLIPIDDLFKIIASLPRFDEIESIDIKDGLNAILAKDIRSRFCLPAFSNSAMDGYLFDTSLPLNSYVDKVISIKEEIFAGTNILVELKANECFKITTGAKIPSNIKKPSVIPLELVEELESGIKIKQSSLNDAWNNMLNIRLKGENLKEDSLIAKKGDRLYFSTLALIASQGIKTLEVFKKPNISIFSSGDELSKEANNKDFLVYDINSISIFNTLKKLGINSSIKDTLKDELDSYLQSITNALEHSNIIIVSGGASVSQKDFGKVVVKKLDSIIYTKKLALKPGKPLIISKIRHNKKEGYFIVLPGNPQACLMNLIMYIAPLIRHLSGEELKQETIKAKNKLTFKINKTMTNNFLGIYENGEFSVFDKGKINSNDISSFNFCNAIFSTINTKDKSEVKNGELIDIYLYKNLL